ncbi:hypothetical protein BDQ94DRAFT_138969 [Aspergillus welwitschiae]|uniref:Uncharacterized protein n=1 Tax=Aspergillus welwitschiae TaxID=1341132 RepID=A0A3F3QB97_9EURO|nr:hypothetical protein BDQ94DRAFT_138969 [Aspergillus welwitschiae]RDH36399.1 hypothetical protein BDQ94DRAFT_138969 [Aspergillus welwitschiae]
MRRYPRFVTHDRARIICRPSFPSFSTLPFGLTGGWWCGSGLIGRWSVSWPFISLQKEWTRSVGWGVKLFRNSGVRWLGVSFTAEGEMSSPLSVCPSLVIWLGVSGFGGTVVLGPRVMQSPDFVTVYGANSIPMPCEVLRDLTY